MMAMTSAMNAMVRVSMTDSCPRTGSGNPLAAFGGHYGPTG
jgi:hypothetical protein